MGAIFRREFKTLFTLPIGCILLAVMSCASGYFFFIYNVAYSSTDLSGVFGNLFTVVMLVLPIVTMRLFSEDKRQKTDQLLLTSPVSLTGIVLGKFLAALLLYALSLLITLVFAVIIALQVTPDWSVILGNYFGLLLLGGLVLSIGVLISSLTESQLIAAIGTLAVSLVLLLIDSLSSLFGNLPLVVAVVDFLSISTRYSAFTTGILAYNNIIYFLSLQALFLFLTVRVLDKKRWG